ncbi:27162_t:CDS:2 [Gigaspora margarita]|uniref:27162_t:CDS:1 n=1 Tax=Gigaspora margarita TaxID=4874 RepID=A0ABM8VVV7_GIGMA|nr:27162_t:CDS:2 [Gigaspora margarita]
MPRKNHYNNTLNKLRAKLRSDNINVSKINNNVKKLIKERKSFLLRMRQRNKIFKENYELEHSNLKKLEAQFNSLISKITRLENDINFYQIENNELKEKLRLLTNSYENNKTELERYYKVIQKTHSVLEGVVNSNEIDLLQLVDLRKELSEICGAVMSDFNIPAAYSNQNNIVFNSFDEALSASEPKISEINEGEENNNGQIIPPLIQSNRFYDKHDQNFDTDIFKF